MSDWRTIRDEKEKYRAYLCSREWALLRNIVRERCDGVCERCRTNDMDCVHHLTYARKYKERPEDLAGWCNQCHDFTHGKSDFDPQVAARDRQSLDDLRDLVCRMRNQGIFYEEMCDALTAFHRSEVGNPMSAWGLVVGSLGGLASDFAGAADRAEWRLGVLHIYVSDKLACAFLNRREIKTQISKCLEKEFGAPLEFEIEN